MGPVALPDVSKDLQMVLGEEGLRDVARKGYEAHATHRGWKDDRGGTIPPWNELPAKSTQAWEVATSAIVLEYRLRAPEMTRVDD